MNKRIQKLRDELTAQKPFVDSERCKIFTESMKNSEGLPIIIRRAMSFYDVLDQMTIRVKPGELIVGNQSRVAKGSPIYPEYSAKWIFWMRGMPALPMKHGYVRPVLAMR